MKLKNYFFVTLIGILSLTIQAQNTSVNESDVIIESPSDVYITLPMSE